MQNHKVKVAIPYAALEPLGVSLLKAGQVDLAGICVLFDAQITAKSMTGKPPTTACPLKSTPTQRKSLPKWFRLT